MQNKYNISIGDLVNSPKNKFFGTVYSKYKSNNKIYCEVLIDEEKTYKFYNIKYIHIPEITLLSGFTYTHTHTVLK